MIYYELFKLSGQKYLVYSFSICKLKSVSVDIILVVVTVWYSSVYFNHLADRWL